MPRLSYYRRIFSAYLLGGKSQLTFWHETPAENPDASANELGPYYMLFSEKADYSGGRSIAPAFQNLIITATSACNITRSRSRNMGWAITTSGALLAILRGGRSSSAPPIGFVTIWKSIPKV
jgi:hypothetical protein